MCEMKRRSSYEVLPATESLRRHVYDLNCDPCDRRKELSISGRSGIKVLDGVIRFFSRVSGGVACYH
ncbi:uncharacterized [Tachysurus ichikawai]